MFVTLALALLIIVAPKLEQLRRRRGRDRLDAPRFYATVHSEMRAGASLRQALAGAAAAQDVPALATVRGKAMAGAPMAEIAASLNALPGGARQAEMSLRVAARSGGRAAAVFLRLADRAAADADAGRQRRALTAQSRLSALVVGGLPLVWLVFGGVGRLRSLIDSGGAAVAVAGLGMEALGVVLVWRLAAT